MNDVPITFHGFLLKLDSEFLTLFNHYLLKGFETGIYKRIETIWNSHLKPPIKIGIMEPKPLEIYNVMFPFSLLAITIVVSIVIALTEKVSAKIRLSGRNVFVKRGMEIAEDGAK